MIRPAPSDPPEIEHILWQGFTPGDLVLDVGANCGQSIPSLKKLSREVWAYEPSVESFEVLNSRYSADPDVTLFSLAVSNENADIELMAAPSKIDTGQLVTHGTRGMEWSDDEMAYGEIRSIEAVTLDEHLGENLSRVGFIKIDVEGHELFVLQGSSRLIESVRPEMLVEIHSEELGSEIQGLLGRHYNIQVVRHPHYAPDSELWRTHFWLKCFRAPHFSN